MVYIIYIIRIVAFLQHENVDNFVVKHGAVYKKIRARGGCAKLTLKSLYLPFTSLIFYIYISKCTFWYTGLYVLVHFIAECTFWYSVGGENMDTYYNKTI